MARTYAQLAAVVFLIVGIGGFLTGDASHLSGGSASGNFAGVALHLTYTRDVVNLVIAGVFAYAGFAAAERDAWIPVLAAGALLLLFAVVGFIHADNAAGSQAIATLHFPLATNVFDLVSGVLSVLAGLGGLAEEPGRRSGAQL